MKRATDSFLRPCRSFHPHQQNQLHNEIVGPISVFVLLLLLSADSDESLIESSGFFFNSLSLLDALSEILPPTALEKEAE